ncbi:MAG: hypothetical protein JJT95_02680 [Pararhodobacter sp.]|nr:hypothetical protein [Pararhodobacter sp.]
MQDDRFMFLRAFFRNPRQISAIAPSSQNLAEAMVSQIPLDARRVIELGAGTGVFTRAILDSGIDPCALDVIEMDEGFSALLRQRHQRLRVHRRRAEEIAGIGLAPADAMVSGLPLLSMSERSQGAILEGAFSLLVPSAPFIQFTYGPSVPLRARLLRELGLTSTRTTRIWRNWPPATVHVLRRSRLSVAPCRQAPASDDRVRVAR